MKLTGLLIFMLVGSSMLAQHAPEKHGVKSHDVPEGLHVGDTAPEIQLSDHEANSYSLYELLKEGPVVLTFYRGNWCPYCSRFLAELTDNVDKIEADGARLVAVSPEEETQIMITYSEKTESQILILHDEGHIMEAYDVDYEVTEEYQDKIETGKEIIIAEHNDQEVAKLPVAATYIIDQDGKIVYRHFDLDYTERAPISEILSVLDQLK